MTDWQAIAAAIRAADSGVAGAGPAPELAPDLAVRAVGGGCINRAAVLTVGGARVFVKHNRADWLAMFEAEAAGLEALGATGTIRAPRPICTGLAGDDAFLVLEYLDLHGRGDAAAAGRQLAALHRVTSPRFGWWRDNTIGSTPQRNREHDDWAAFFARERLGFQLELAARNGHRGRLLRDGERLCERVPALLDHRPVASLLHGDLWGGNLGYTADGAPVIFDPAVYFGDREADLAMTELFGGFGGDFYAAYHAAWPLAPGYAVRKTLYNLYHVLNHLNLFGGGYAGQAEAMIARLLAESG